MAGANEEGSGRTGQWCRVGGEGKRFAAEGRRPRAG